ncbi:unnamed protein product [Phytomonas sp. Hart1]|nr:unnamed protein product [Phytomonas sp. Hart1]|eukprot:CCW69961.1 unnamed protein product [Phytomonas sp. isolate Hart1]
MALWRRYHPSFGQCYRCSLFEKLKNKVRQLLKPDRGMCAENKLSQAPMWENLKQHRQPRN